MELTENMLWLLKQAFHLALRTVNEGVADRGGGVTLAQVGLMRQLTSRPGLSGAELSRQLLITPQAVQLALKILEKRGLVERKPDPTHGRILQTFLTDHGHEVAAAVVGDAIAAHHDVFGVLTTAEQQTLHDLLGRVVEQGTGHNMFPDHIDN
ncbi:MarR family winged helix-turn-helix transcriptional regulator [Nocardia alni]|uniref:MarR family winged helix-turn-helix transcriptional regulator n=1 Tax=Nocardia alni TaxID=2815723 RepID=UPI001C22CFC8|nr:MarR family transcriptional regulator [Nocardia alni]